MDVFRGNDNAGNPVAPGLGLTTLKTDTLYQAIVVNKNLEGIQYLVKLKDSDLRFAEFELVDRDNTALCYACQAGNYNLVKDLLRKAPNGQFILPLTNPVVWYNKPFISACYSGNVEIVKMLMERDTSGKYIYNGIDPSAQDYLGIVTACLYSHLDVVKFLLEMKDGKYVLPEINSVDLALALSNAIEFEWNWDNIDLNIMEFLLSKSPDGSYLLFKVEGMEDILTMFDRRYKMRKHLGDASRTVA